MSNREPTGRGRICREALLRAAERQNQGDFGWLFSRYTKYSEKSTCGVPKYNIGEWRRHNALSMVEFRNPTISPLILMQ
jgi:hypothetical protein